MRIAIVHDWLVTYAGAERVLEQMLICFPQADVYSLVDFLDDEQRMFLGGRVPRTSFMQRLPFVKTKYRSYLPIMPLAVEQFDLSGYDIIISSSHAVAKGVLVGPDQLHICMCYSPIRYAWDLQHQYLVESGLDRGWKSLIARKILHNIRMWDTRTANSVDKFIAISHFIERRIEKVYRRQSVVIYPPVDSGAFVPGDSKGDFYLAASRMVPYKRMPMIVEAFSRMPDKRLIVIGTGPDYEKCRKLASDNVSLLGWQPFSVLVSHMQRAKAFVFAAEEDFGIAPLEAQACGTPVIAYGRGAVTETVIGLGAVDSTGVFFNDQTVESLCEAISEFESNSELVTAAACRQNVERFSVSRFRKQFADLVLDEWQSHSSRIAYRAGL